MERDVVQNRSELVKLKDKYEEIVLKDPSSPAFVFLAEILRKQGDLHRATEILIRGLRNHPDIITARIILGKIYYDRWMIDQAKNEMEKVIRVAPDNIDAAKMLIQIYRSEENYNKALETCHSALVFDPEDHELRKNMNEIEKESSHDWTKTGSTKTGQIVNDILELDVSPKGEPTSNLVIEELYTEAMANMYIDQRSYEKAITVLEKLIQREPENTLIRTKLNLSKSYLLSERSGFEIRRK
ncbi:MAG: tetratricopeptide repeat protein [Deltaproteobacteria bacterium]|nr:tetratricopeptide repeat protein [Deltaproteobacteria bacterium]